MVFRNFKLIILFIILFCFNIYSELLAQDLSLKVGASLNTKLSEDILDFPIPVKFNPGFDLRFRFDLQFNLVQNFKLINYYGLQYRRGNLKIPAGYDFSNYLIYNQQNYTYFYFSTGVALKTNILNSDNFKLNILAGASLRLRFYDEQIRDHSPVPYKINTNPREFDDNIFGINGLVGLQLSYKSFLFEISAEPEFLNSKIGTIGYYKQLSFILLVEIKNWE